MNDAMEILFGLVQDNDTPDAGILEDVWADWQTLTQEDRRLEHPETMRLYSEMLFFMEVWEGAKKMFLDHSDIWIEGYRKFNAQWDDHQEEQSQRIKEDRV